jgi:hypothetical protein
MPFRFDFFRLSVIVCWNFRGTKKYNKILKRNSNKSDCFVCFTVYFMPLLLEWGNFGTCGWQLLAWPTLLTPFKRARKTQCIMFKLSFLFARTDKHLKVFRFRPFFWHFFLATHLFEINLCISFGLFTQVLSHILCFSFRLAKAPILYFTKCGTIAWSYKQINW